ncbi:MAG: hypothetical protein M1816_002942 [Peltula sp. TS41687]|nr:MAG: hypothetical protein M1816_002942 [Peltula sp. TS41687]
MTATTLARSTPNTTDLTQAVVNTNLGRKSSPPTLEKTDEASEPGAGLGNDSGYASLSNTPDRPTSSVSSFSQEGVTLSGRKLFQPAITKLKGFDQEIPESVRDRFLDLKELFDGPLYDYLSKLKVNVGDVSIKLKILGESEGTAKPWIVVQCEKDVSRMVKLFFKQKHVRVVYQPRDQSSDLPYFEILFCDRLLRRNADDDNIEVYSCAGTDIGIRRTLCGTLIKVSEGQESCTATLGGVVLVKKSGKSPQLYAITAGHVLRPVQGEHEGSQTSYQGGYGEDDFLSDDEDNFELDGELEEEDDAVEDLDKPGTYSWSKIGHVFDASLDMPSTHYNLDWTLFTIDDPKHYRPNLLVELADDTSRYHNVGHLGTLSSSERQIQSGQEVVVLSGTGGNKKGSISIRNSFLMLAPGKRFVDTYDLTLTDGSKLSAGDSGSWVVDQKSFEVYGHVVATDAFGEALVIPMKSTLQDIKDRFAMDEVSIPDVTQVECCQLEIMATVRPTSSELLSSRSVVVGAAAVSKNLNSDIHQFQQQADPSDHSDILETFAHLRSESERPTSRREWREVSSPDPLAKPQAQDGHKHYHESGQSQTSSDKPTLPIPQEQPEPHSSWLTAAPNVALEPMGNILVRNAVTLGRPKWMKQHVTRSDTTVNLNPWPRFHHNIIHRGLNMGCRKTLILLGCRKTLFTQVVIQEQFHNTNTPPVVIQGSFRNPHITHMTSMVIQEQLLNTKMPSIQNQFCNTLCWRSRAFLAKPKLTPPRQ